MSGKKKVLLKIIILGESGVGKTALLHRYVHGKFIEEHKATIGADFVTQEIKIDDKIITLQMWDTAGQERFQSLGNAFYRGADACILVYDTTNEQSFIKIDEWKQNFMHQASPDEPNKFPFLLLGNKIDLSDRRKVDTTRGNSYASKNNMIFFETSAANGTGVQDAIKEIASTASDMETVPFFSDEVAKKIVLEDDDNAPAAKDASQCPCSVI